MSANLPEFRRGVIRPVQCIDAGWQLIKAQYWLFLGIIVVGLLIGSAVPLGIILGPMMCGIYLCLFKRMRGEAVSFDLLFKGFDYFAESLIATLIQVVPMFVLIMIIYVLFFVGMMGTAVIAGGGSRGGPPDPGAFFAFLGIVGVFYFLLIMVIILVSMFFIFTYPLIVDRRLSGLDAIKTSIRAVIGNFGGGLGLMLLNALLGVVGILLCYFGIFLVMPISLAAWAVAYRQVF